MKDIVRKPTKKLVFASLWFLFFLLRSTDIVAQTEYVPISSVAWSPDGSQIAVGVGSYLAENHNYAVQILSATTGEIIASLDYHTGNVVSLDWSPDGTKLVSSGGADSVGIVWDMITGQQIALSQAYSMPGRFADIWSPDGTLIANVSDGNPNLNLWNPDTGQRISSFSTREYSRPISVAWSPDGSKLVTGHYLGSVVIWNSETGLPILELGSHENTVTTVAWSSDGNHIATGSWDNTVRIWDASIGEILHTLEQHTGIVWKLVWSEDSRYLASAGEDRTARVWNIDEGQTEYIYWYEGAIHALDWSPDGRFLAFGGEASENHDAELKIVEIPAS